jgi:hypothetical protein
LPGSSTASSLASSSGDDGEVEDAGGGFSPARRPAFSDTPTSGDPASAADVASTGRAAADTGAPDVDANIVEVPVDVVPCWSARVSAAGRAAAGGSVINDTGIALSPHADPASGVADGPFDDDAAESIEFGPRDDDSVSMSVGVDSCSERDRSDVDDFADGRRAGRASLTLSPSIIGRGASPTSLLRLVAASRARTRTGPISGCSEIS